MQVPKKNKFTLWSPILSMITRIMLNMCEQIESLIDIAAMNNQKSSR